MIASRSNLMPPAPQRNGADISRANGAPVERSSVGLRDALFDEIDRLRRGEGDPKQALAIALLARNILAAVGLEYRLAKDGPPPAPLRLGRGGPS